jgi:hypothetical protein
VTLPQRVSTRWGFFLFGSRIRAAAFSADVRASLDLLQSDVDIEVIAQLLQSCQLGKREFRLLE